MPADPVETLHERYGRDERRLIETARDQLWTDLLLDGVIDVAAPIMAATAWDGIPADAPPRTLSDTRPQAR